MILKSFTHLQNIQPELPISQLQVYSSTSARFRITIGRIPTSGAVSVDYDSKLPQPDQQP